MESPSQLFNDNKRVKDEHIVQKTGICCKCKVNINKTFIPVKMALYFWFAASFSAIAFIPVFMKHRGFTVTEFATIRTISIPLQLLGGVVSGIFADKIGRTKPIMMGYFIIYLLVILSFALMPKITECGSNTMNFTCQDDDFTLFTADYNCVALGNNTQKFSCSKISFRNATLRENQSNCIHVNNVYASEDIIAERNMLHNNSNICRYNLSLKNNLTENLTTCGIENCDLLIVSCTSKSSTNCIENKEVWILIYCIAFIVYDVTRSTLFKLFDVTVVDLTVQHGSDYGRQRVWSMIGGLSGPPIVGFLLNALSSDSREKDYSVAFYCIAVGICLSAASLWRVNSKLNKPSKEMGKQAQIFFKDLNTCLFLLLLLVTGSLLDFHVMFKNWYLQDIGASDFLLGICTGMVSLYGLPVLYYSRWWINKIGEQKCFILALLGYTILGFTYSVLQEPWIAVIVDSTCIFSYHLFWVSALSFVVKVAPEGLQATMKALASALHFNGGKIISTTLGGYIMSYYGGRVAYKVMGSCALVYTVIYGAYLMAQFLTKKKAVSQLQNNLN